MSRSIAISVHPDKDGDIKDIMHEIRERGMSTSYVTKKLLRIYRDRGYSFCKCKGDSC